MACYVFSRAFPMERLLIPALLVFFTGTVKYGERTRALYLASMGVYGFSETIHGKADPGPNYAKLASELTSKFDASLPAKIIFEKQHTILTIADDDDRHEESKTLTSIQVIRRAHRFVKKFKGLIANLIGSFNDRRDNQAYFSGAYVKEQRITSKDAFRIVEAELNFIYEDLYTKGAVVHTRTAYVLRALCSCAILVSLVLFAFANKQNYDRIDIGITYALLGGAVGLDVVALIMLTLSDIAIISFCTTRFVQPESFALYILEKIQSSKNPRWSESMGQYNLINYCLARSSRCVDWIVSKIGTVSRIGLSRDLLDNFLYTFYTPVDLKLREFIYSELMKKSKRATDPRSISSYIGSRALEDRGFQRILGWSVEAEFDESLLLWHIATDICYNVPPKNIEEANSRVGEEGSNHEKNTATDICNFFRSRVIKLIKKPEEGNSNTNKQKPHELSTEDLREISKKLSEYMLYLLVEQPSMMSVMAGIGLIRYRDTCAEAKRFFPIKTEAQAREMWNRLKKAREMLIAVNTDHKAKDVKGIGSKSALFDAVRLAKELNGLSDQRKWNIIAEVWVEMLSYAASHCTGHAHAAQLSKGGELLMFVWFLMAHLGLGKQFVIEEGSSRPKLIVEK